MSIRPQLRGRPHEMARKSGVMKWVRIAVVLCAGHRGLQLKVSCPELIPKSGPERLFRFTFALISVAGFEEGHASLSQEGLTPRVDA